MKALVFTGPGRAEVREVRDPSASAGEAVIEIELAGICGTDTELFRGDMAYFEQGLAKYPLRPGHEWCGRVVEVGTGVDPGWLGLRVTGDTMLGCGQCARCRRNMHHVCENRFEVGIRGGWPGALAERLVVPVTSLYRLPDAVTSIAGAMVEPGGNAIRAAWACDIHEGDRVLVWGTATVGLLSALFARSFGAEVTVVGRRPDPVEFARSLGLAATTEDSLPNAPFDAIIDATNGPTIPDRALQLVEPGGRLSLIGLAGRPSTIDTRDLVLKDVTAVGLLGASAGLADAIARYADGAVDPEPLVGRTVGLEEAIDVLSGAARVASSPGPKTLVDPSR